MDPQATLNNLFESILDSKASADDVYDYLVALLDWRVKGGFLPDLETALNHAENFLQANQ
jgi:hypothetical protein